MRVLRNSFRRPIAHLFTMLALVATHLFSVAQSPLLPVNSFPASTPVGQTSAAISVAVRFIANGSPVAPQVVTQGAAGGDFAVVPGGTCTAGVSYFAAQQCTVNVVFQPKFPGLRSGAVQLLSGSGSLLGSALVAGSATGALAVLPAGQIDDVAGAIEWLYRGDGVPANGAPIFLPMGVTEDAAGNIYIADSNNYRIRRVDAQSGLISTIAGDGSPGYSGDGGPARQAMISTPAGLALDGAGNLYFADTGNHCIRRIDAISQTISTVAGTGGQQGYSGDSGAATAALLAFPQSVAFDIVGDLLIADTGNNVLRRVDVLTGFISTIAGTGVAGYNGDSRTAVSAQLNSPWSVTVGPDGSIYIADLANNRVRRIDGSGTISTVAGRGNRGYAGDGAAATAALLNSPEAVVLDPAGDLYIADSANNYVRKVNAATGYIETLTPTLSLAEQQAYAANGTPVTPQTNVLYGPDALFFDFKGNLLIADMFHNHVRRLDAAYMELQYKTMRVGKVSAPQAVALANAGNAPLTLNAPLLSQSALDPTTSSCQTGSVLAPAASCNAGVDFAPTIVGPAEHGSLTLTSNSAAPPPFIFMQGDVLSVEPTSVTLTSSINPSLLAQSVTFTATVSSADTGRSGTVVFTDTTAAGSKQLCSVALNSAGTATCTTSALSLGQHNITAAYSGDGNNAASASPVLAQTVKQTPSLLLTVAPNPAVVTQSITLNFTASASSGSPTGTVTFMDGATTLASANLTSGTVSFTTSGLLVGTHALSVQYAGDALNASGASNTVSEAVQAAATATTLSSSSGTANVGVSITLTAAVASPGGPAPTGSVQFMDGSTAIGTSPLVNGTAALTTATLTPGSHILVAVYSGDANDATSQSAPLSEAIQKIATTTGLAADVNPLSAGATLHLTATVSPASSTGGTLSGNVTFTEGATTLGVSPVDAAGHAALALSTLAVGSHSIVATYAGGSNYSGSAAAPLVEIIQQTATVTVLSASAASTLAGKSASFTATVISATGVPTGKVAFQDGATLLGQATLNAQGVATFSSVLPVGAHSLTATYITDGYYTGSSSAPVTFTVLQGPTTASIVSSANPVTLGLPVTFTASLTSDSPNLTGAVTFSDGASVLGSVPLTNGSAALTLSTLTFGTHPISATYSGDTNHLAATSSTLSELVVQPALATLTSSLNPSSAGNNVIFTAKLSGSAASNSGPIVPTGPVVFRDGGNVLGTTALDASGTATLALSTLAVGSHTVTAAYSGDANYSAGAASLIQTVQSASTQVILTSGANPATYGSPLTLSVRVTSNGTTASGSVNFVEAGAALGTALLDPNGLGTLTLSTLSPGPHMVVANYLGDGRAGASSSTPLSFSVKQVSSIALTSGSNPAATLSAIALTATVTDATGGAGGSVTFSDGAVQLGIVTLSGGVAVLSVPQLAAGSHSITASYAGDAANFSSVSSAFTQTVALRPTSTTVSGTATDPNNPQQVLLIGVAHATGPAAATGKVSFTSGSLLLGSGTVDANGVATLTVILPPGTNTIAASYSGDESYAGSTSTNTAITIGAPTQFSLALTPATVKLQSGQHGTATLTANSTSAFADTLLFGCLGLPYAATCNFTSPSKALPAGGSVTVTVDIDTGDPLGAGSAAGLFLPVALVAGLALYSRRRRLLPVLLACVAVVLTLSASGCGGLHTTATPPGTYTFRITAAGQGTGIAQSQLVTLTVTQ